MANSDPAAGRFWLLQLLRLAGVIMCVSGAMILAEALKAPFAFGVVLLVSGAWVYFFIPAILARRWKNRSE